MILSERYLKKSHFSNLTDFQTNFEVLVPDSFNFAYDVVDEYARLEPKKLALVWVNDRGENRNFTFA
ncbi:MAG TPA: hypothetical protein VKA27_04040, partial [Sunxiuqinia sp.]|nr:hypothetical protein [Sunxiuqinia sp.]